jgi:hypothetical protein
LESRKRRRETGKERKRKTIIIILFFLTFRLFPWYKFSTFAGKRRNMTATRRKHKISCFFSCAKFLELFHFFLTSTFTYSINYYLIYRYYIINKKRRTVPENWKKSSIINRSKSLSAKFRDILRCCSNSDVFSPILLSILMPLEVFHYPREINHKIQRILILRG